jgi:hypothetical protein
MATTPDQLAQLFVLKETLPSGPELDAVRRLIFDWRKAHQGDKYLDRAISSLENEALLPKIEAAVITGDLLGLLDIYRRRDVQINTEHLMLLAAEYGQLEVFKHFYWSNDICVFPERTLRVAARGTRGARDGSANPVLAYLLEIRPWHKKFLRTVTGFPENLILIETYLQTRTSS